MLKKLKKGFTLTELIIVIVIIGILAAVLIPSISGYIKKAKISKGVQEAREMNTILAAEAIYRDKEYLEPYEIRQLIEESDFKLESGLEDYRFWYDASVNQIKYLSMDEAFSGVRAAGKSFAQDCVEALSSSHPEYRYMDSYDDEITDAVKTVTNLIETALKANGVTDSSNSEQMTAEKKTAILNKMDELVGKVSTALSTSKIKGLPGDAKKSMTNYLSTFDTTNSVYVDNNVMYNRAYFIADTTEMAVLANSKTNIDVNGDKFSVSVAHMVFTPGITMVPACTTGTEIEVTFSTTVTIPSTVTTVQNNSFTNVTFIPGLVVTNTMIIDNEALSDSIKGSVTTVNTNSNFVTLYLGTDFEISYENAEAKLNNGKIAVYERSESDPNPVRLETVIYNGSKLIYDGTNSVEENRNLISKYLVPSIKFNSGKIDFSKITKFVIRRSLFNNICTYTGILIDEDLNSYKIESFGYITDIDWNIEQNFMSKVNGNLVVGATEATVKVYLPSYVYNFTNYKGAKMEVTLLPQYIKTKEESTMTGTIDVFDGIALAEEPIIFYIEDGVFNPETGMYEYTKEIPNLNQYTLMVNGVEVECNQLYINKISVYTGKVSYNEQGKPVTDDLTYLFIRYYK